MLKAQESKAQEHREGRGFFGDFFPCNLRRVAARFGLQSVPKAAWGVALILLFSAAVYPLPAQALVLGHKTASPSADADADARGLCALDPPFFPCVPAVRLCKAARLCPAFPAPPQASSSFVPVRALGHARLIGQAEIAQDAAQTPFVYEDNLNDPELDTFAEEAFLDLGEEMAVRDPLENLNRAVFSFNQALDHAVIVPVATGYRDLVPRPLRDAVRNFLRNLSTPVILANNLLQGDFKGAEVALSRAIVNTVIGFGFLDLASEVGLTYAREDFGQTLGRYGVGDGIYIVLPLLGPTTARDSLGIVVDTLADPFNQRISEEASFLRFGLTYVDIRSRNLDLMADLERGSIDYYSRVRSAYIQARQRQIAH